MKSIKTLSALMLSTALALGAAGASAQAQTDTSHASAGIEQTGSNAWITTKVKSKLATTKGVPSTDISVDTAEGVVTLTGMLPSKMAVNKAITAAKSIKGVKKVDASGLKAQ